MSCVGDIQYKKMEGKSQGEVAVGGDFSGVFSWDGGPQEGRGVWKEMFAF